MSFTIRIANENDFEKIHAINRRFAEFINTPEKFQISIEAMKEDHQHFRMLVAEHHGGEIVGFASMFFAWYSWIGKSLYLDDLYIVEKFRGAGLGTALFENVLIMAKKENCKKVRWQVSKWNTPAIEFYKKKGAIIDDVEINCDLIV